MPRGIPNIKPVTKPAAKKVAAKKVPTKKTKVEKQYGAKAHPGVEIKPELTGMAATEQAVADAHSTKKRFDSADEMFKSLDNPGSGVHIDGQPLGYAQGFGILFARPAPLDIDAVITRTIENNLSDLEYLRSALDSKNQKHIMDVREFGDTAGGALLRGVEETIEYDDLVDIITNLKDGLAERRVAAKRAAALKLASAVVANEPLAGAEHA